MLHDDAERLVALWIDSTTDGEAVILHEQTLDKPYGWIFFYQSRAYVESGDSTHAFVGNAPIIVNRFTPELRPLGTALPLEEYLKEYEASLPSAQLQAKPQLRERRPTPLDVRSFRRAVRDWTDVDLAAFHLARSLGLMSADTDFALDAKQVFWSDNALGSALYGTLDGLASAGVLLKRDDPDHQIRWNPEFRETWVKHRV